MDNIVINFYTLIKIPKFPFIFVKTFKNVKFGFYKIVNLV